MLKNKFKHFVGKSLSVFEGLKAGLLLRAKLNSRLTWKTPFLLCFGLTTLQIRGGNYFQLLFFV